MDFHKSQASSFFISPSFYISSDRMKDWASRLGSISTAEFDSENPIHSISPDITEQEAMAGSTQRQIRFHCLLYEALSSFTEKQMGVMHKQIPLFYCISISFFDIH